MLRIVSRGGQMLLLAASLVLMFCEIFLPSSIIGQFSRETVALPMVGLLAVALIDAGFKFKALKHQMGMK